MFRNTLKINLEGYTDKKISFITENIDISIKLKTKRFRVLIANLIYFKTFSAEIFRFF